MGWLRSVGIRLVVYPVIGYAALGLGLYVGQTEILFPAPRTFERLTPANLRMPYDDLRIPVREAGWLHAWWIPDDEPARKTILVFHGNAYVLEESLQEVIELHKLGANLLVVDYRGYGLSSRATPSEATVNEDANAALAWLMAGKGAAEGDVLVLGRSIGTGPAIYLATGHPGLAGLILESPFTSIEDAAKAAWPGRFYPVHLLLRTHFDNLSRIGHVRAPVLIVAGTADTLTPAWMAARLYERANEPKELYLVRGAEHNNLVDVGGEALVQALQRFVHRGGN